MFKAQKTFHLFIRVQVTSKAHIPSVNLGLAQGFLLTFFYIAGVDGNLWTCSQGPSFKKGIHEQRSKSLLGPLTLHYTDWFIEILKMAFYNSCKTG